MSDLFPTGLAFIMRPENDGQSYHVTPGDAGGDTNHGVTWANWQAWCRQHSTRLVFQEFRDAPAATFTPIYRAWFWNACRCASLGPIGIAVFDMAVTAGPGTAAKTLQRALGLDEDGELGPVTVRAANAVPRMDMNTKFLAARLTFYADLNQPQFLHGWERRAKDCYALVTSLI